MVLEPTKDFSNFEDHWPEKIEKLQLLKKEQNENELQHNMYHVILDPLLHFQELFLLSHL